jgi:iron(III) transport system substrate-binding protein
MQRSIPSLTRARRVGAAAVAAAAVALFVVGCSSSPAKPSAVPGDKALASILSAAQKEGSLTIYGSPGETGVDAALAEFQQKYGITATYVRLAGTQLESRYAAEKEAGSSTADLIMLNLDAFVPEAIQKKLVTPPADLKIPGYPWKFPSKFLLPDYGTAVVGLGSRGITYNKNFVKDGEITTWSDLLKPKYKGHIGIPNPVSADVYTGHWYTVGQHQKGGAKQFLSAVGEQLAPNAVYAAGAPATAAAGAGEVWMIPMNIASLTKSATDQGAPLGFVIPDKTVADQQVMFANSKPDHPNATKLWVAYMLSQGGSQTMTSANGELSPYDTSKLPKTIWTWPLSLVAEQKANVNHWLTGR